MSEKRRGLGRGLGALIPSGPAATRPPGDRPVDVFFPGGASTATVTQERPADGDGEAATGGDLPAGASADDTAGDTADDKPSDTSGDSTRTAGETPGAEARADGGAPAPAADGASAPAVSRETDAAAPQGAEDAAPAPEAPVSRETGEAGVSRETAAEDDGELLPVPGARYAEIPLDRITPNPKQPRSVFDEDAMAELVHSVREIGVLQPIVVRQVAGTPGSADERYELIMGERRWRASTEAGLEAIPAIVRDTTEDDLLRDALLENLHRSNLNPLEEAAAYQQLLDDFDCTHEVLATRIGRSRPQISNTLRLMKLPPLVQRRVAAGVLSAGHARALLGLEDGAAMERLAQRIVAEGLSVRTVEEIVALGDGETPRPSRRPRAGTRHVELDDLAGRLSDRFDTRVKIALGRSRGRLTVEFASVEDLNRIVDMLAPGENGAFRPES